MVRIEDEQTANVERVVANQIHSVASESGISSAVSGVVDLDDGTAGVGVDEGEVGGNGGGLAQEVDVSWSRACDIISMSKQWDNSTTHRSCWNQ